eukprot:1150565-Pelagomonas_calceolata.AAC.3
MEFVDSTRRIRNTWHALLESVNPIRDLGICLRIHVLDHKSELFFLKFVPPSGALKAEEVILHGVGVSLLPLNQGLGMGSTKTVNNRGHEHWEGKSLAWKLPH